MKKLLVIVVLMLALVVSACGGPSVKDQAKALNEKYYGEKGEVSVFNEELGVTFKYENFSEKYNTEMKRLSEKSTNINNMVNAEKVIKEVEPLKQAILEEQKVNIDFMKLVMLEIDAHINKKELNISETQIDELANRVNKSKYNRLNEYNKLVEGKYIPLAVINGMNYKAYVSSDVLLAVTNVQTKQELGRTFNEKALGKFAVVKVYVKNNQKDAITVDSTSFKLVDNQKREFSKSTRGESAIQLEEGNTRGFLTQLNPGMSAEFKFVYDIPKDLNVGDLKLQGRGGFNGSKVIMDLNILKFK